MKILAGIVATFFGVGLFPVAPGTVTSALVVSGLFFSGLSSGVLIALAGGTFFLGVWASGTYASELGVSDPGRIVIDEVCGQTLAFALVPGVWPAAVLVFAFFRFFDIVKPFPLRTLERLPGGWGIMADDVGAGLAAAAAVRLLFLILQIAGVR